MTRHNKYYICENTVILGFSYLMTVITLVKAISTTIVTVPAVYATVKKKIDKAWKKEDDIVFRID